MVQIRQSYLRAFPKKNDFVEYMSEWVKKPKEETSIMLHAVKKYELMPFLHFNMESLKEISVYIYETDFEKEHKGHTY
ncbi:cytochrome C [Sulfurimonas sp.]|uniref:cytochrome C n=1 Tax=Sulfurimonas sp. TaxID=2022749 RepID=UPI0025F831CC|nr:cytochrome C [Sulfurimonas sp.]